jgi:hypothetical protein
VLVDDVLYTGRTIRAVLNELFDFGRPASVHAGGAGRPRRPRAADRGAFAAARIACRPGAAPVAGARRRAASASRSRSMPDAGAATRSSTHGELIHLLSIEGLPRAVLTQILDTASTFLRSTTAR